MDIDPRRLQQRLACAIQNQKRSSAVEQQYAVIIRQAAQASKIARDLGRVKLSK
jgi:hypothetical protein